MSWQVEPELGDSILPSGGYPHRLYRRRIEWFVKISTPVGALAGFLSAVFAPWWVTVCIFLVLLLLAIWGWRNRN